ncbi:hypothetical protein [Spartinivicinus ruber]|uniref:hypothetical protein n=1 Tax=Spartinivicinus ruber TaxID=2683272 RepID=UPI0013D67879|nr:hypothetical protein [Spartinivicinus ruber]
MKIDLPSIDEQKKIILEEGNKAAIRQLNANLKAPIMPKQTEIDESKYPNTHLLRETEGWEPPHPDIVGAYFRHFQSCFSAYNSDKRLAELLGVTSDRRVREFKQGKNKVPYGVWRKFLVMTGQVPQDVIPVLAIFQ